MHAVAVRSGILSCKKTKSFLRTKGTIVTLNLISVANTVLVPFDEIYIGFFGKNEFADRLAGSVGWRSF